jgi:hypothetical protein
MTELSRRQPQPAAGDAEAIRLIFPGRGDLMVLARITAATIAAGAGFGLEDIEDLRLAVEELCLLVRGRREGVLHLSFRFVDDELEVHCRLSPTAATTVDHPSEAELHDFSEQILDALVDDWGESSEGTAGGMWLRMRPAQGIDDS